MLDSIRKKASIIIIVVVIAFALTIVLDWGMNVLGIHTNHQNDPVGKIDDQEITYQQYHNSIQKVYMEYKNQAKDREITDQEMEKIREQAWNNLINEYVFADIIEKNDIRVSDNELVQFIKFSPPAEVRQIEQFKTDGKFDFQKYLSFIQSPQSGQFIQQMEYVFRNSLPQDKIYYRFFSTINVTDKEVEQYFHLKNDKVRVNYIAYGTDMVNNEEVSVSEDEMNAYYQDHKEDYKTPEQVALSVYKVFKRATPKDIMDAQKRVNEIYGKMNEEGQTFEELARYYSEDKVTADKDGDLGFMSRNDFRLKELEDKVFSLKEGEVTEPLKNKNRWYVFKCEEKREKEGEEEVKLRQIVVKEEASDETIDALRAKVKDIVDAVKEKEMTLKDVEAEWNIKFAEAGKVNREHYGFLPQIGFLQGVNSFIRSAEKNEVSKRYYENEQGFYVLSVTEVSPESYKSFEEVKTVINNELIKEKKLDVVKSRISGMAAKVNSAKTLKDIDENAKIDSTSMFGRMDFVPNVGRNNPFIATAFQKNVNEIAGPVKSDDAYYFIQVVEKSVATDKEFEGTKDKVKQEYSQYLKNIRFQTWFMSLREQYEIEDNRSAYFF